MLNAIETYLTPAEELCRLCGRARANACANANGHRLGNSRALGGATRRAAESRLPLCALRPG